jgi:regulator of cell morphogenesis and NO signaling
MTLDATQTVREIVQQHPGAVPVFEALGIDYCCGGGKSLEDACRSKSISPEAVLSDLEQALAAKPVEDEQKWQTCSLGELTDHIVQQHHSYATRELTRLSALAEKVFSRHGDRHPHLRLLRDLLNATTAEMLPHMLKEEQLLFPAFKLLEEAGSGASATTPLIISLAKPVQRLMDDHDDTGEILRSIRQLTNNFEPPAGACMSYQALYHGLSELERNIHMHIHLENNVLFPRVLHPAKSN